MHSSASMSPLVGRAAEQAAIAALLDGAAAGAGAALMFRGRLGVGKTALLAYAARAAAGCTVVELHPDPSEAGLAYAGVHRLLEVLSARLDLAGDELRLAVRVLEVVRGAAAERPLLCCVDDLQCLDPPSRDILTFVARRLPGHRVALLFAVRDEDAGPAEPPSGVEIRQVLPLDEQHSRELIRESVPDAAVAAALTAVAGGNPQALLELAGALTPEQRCGAAPALPELPDGSALRSAYRNLLDRLPAAARRLVQLAATDPQLTADELVRAASLAGDQVAAVDPDGLARATGLAGDTEAAAGLAGDSVAALGPAEAAGLVCVDGSEVRFPAPVVRLVVRAEATLAERRSVHALLARALDPRTQPLRHLLHLAASVPAPDAALAARLERAAGEHGRADYAAASRALERAAELSDSLPAAAHRLIAAARQAWRAGEPHRARLLLRRVRPASAGARARARWELVAGEIELRTGEATVARDRLLAAADASADRDRHLAISALLRAGDALGLTGDHARYADLAERALALRRPDDPLDVEFVVELVAGLAATFRGEHGRAADPLRRSVELATALDETGALTRAGLAALLLGDPTRAHRLAARAAAVARGRGEISAIPQALELAALAGFVMGRFDTAAAGLEGLRLARQSGQDSLVSSQLATLALRAAATGDRQACLSRVRDARALPEAGRIGRARALSEWALAVLDVTAGDHRRAVDRLRGLTRATPRHGHLIVRVAATPYLVEAAVRCGEHATARRCLAAFDAWAASTGSTHWLALSARCHALLAQDVAGAQEHFEEALRRHDLSPAEFDRARTQLLFGQWLRRRRRPAAAREPLRLALETFEGYGARPWAERARAELRAAGESVPLERPAGTAVLTPHQLQIARLVAEGATNREVAARIRVSTRTVDHHMRNILAKLGVRSRVELSNLIR